MESSKQYVRNFDKSVRFKAALNLARDVKSVSAGIPRIDYAPTEKIVTYIVIRLFDKQFITMTTKASTI